MNCVARGGETPLRRSRRREGKREGGGGVAGAGRLRPRGSKGGESGRASGRAGERGKAEKSEFIALSLYCWGKGRASVTAAAASSVVYDGPLDPAQLHAMPSCRVISISQRNTNI